MDLNFKLFSKTFSIFHYPKIQLLPYSNKTDLSYSRLDSILLQKEGLKELNEIEVK